MIILASIICLTDLSASMCLCVVFTGKILFRPMPPTIHHSCRSFTSKFFSTELLGALIQQVCEKSNRKNLRMSFKQLVGESIAEAWEHYHLFVVETSQLPEWKIGILPKDSIMGCLKKPRNTSISLLEELSSYSRLKRLELCLRR
jgi:hypothetical protein